MVCGTSRFPAFTARLRRFLSLSLAVVLIGSQIVFVAPAAMAAQSSVTFQHGANGYSGVVDTFVKEDTPDQDHGANPRIEIDASILAQGLVRFDGIVGSGMGQIPPGSTVTGATLSLQNTSNASVTGATMSLHRMLIAWTASSTWNSTGTGIQLNDIEAVSRPDSTTTAGVEVSGGTVVLSGLQSAVQSWVDGSPNHGWVVTLDNSDGWDGHSSEATTVNLSPRLSVTYSINTPPVANDDAATTGRNSPVIINVLTNDNDGEDDPLTVDSVSQPANGTAANNGNNVTYTPDRGFVGTNVFTYTASDGNGGTSTANVTVTVLSSIVVVNSTGDAPDASLGDGFCDTGGSASDLMAECTMRAAIQEANATASIDTIHLGIPASDPGHASGIWTIAPGSALPQIVSTVDIDAFTQPGWTATPVIRIDGTATTGVSGLSLGASSDASRIRGLMITGFDVDGIAIVSGADGVRIEHSWIGSDGSGSSIAGNGDDGIDVRGAGAVIEGNVVNHSGDEGIDVRASGTTIIGNMIGLESDGSSGAGNHDVGIALFANNTTIGGQTASERNVISNNWEAIEVNTSNNVIQGNYIGTDATGTLDRGNRIGDGIEVQAGTGNLIGGTAVGEGNLIAYNRVKGVDITGGNDNTIVGNEIHSNGALGIDLGPTGVSANDAGDGDTGANDLLNFPTITSAVQVAGTMSVGFDLDAAAGSYRIEFYTNSAVDPSGHGEGESFVGSYTVASHPGGPASYTYSTTGGGTGILTATTTECTIGASCSAFGSTSEFSAGVPIVQSNAAPSFDQDLGDRTDPEGIPPISISSAASDPDGDTLGYSATGLPLGISIHPTTGLISGIINHAAAARGPYSVVVTVTDGNGGSDADAFTWSVTDVPATPPYVVGGAGGGNGGDDLLTAVNPVDIDPATNEVDIGAGTGTAAIEAIAIEPLTGVVYAIDGAQVGILNTDSGVFTPVGSGIGTADGRDGNIVLDNIRGMTFHPLTGVIWATHRRSATTDLLFPIDPATGQLIRDTFSAGWDYIEVKPLGSLQDVTDIAFDPTDWALYGVMTDGAPQGVFDLVTIRVRNGRSHSIGTLARPLIGLSFNPVGQLYGTSPSTLFSVNKLDGTLGMAHPLDNASNYGALDFGLTPQYPPALEGTVFEDISGNLLAGGELIEDSTNPGVGGVTVHLYLDNGSVPGEPDAGDTLYASKVTGPTGHYYFSELPLSDYWIIVDSKSVTPSAGGSGWAEQTYGPAGSVTFDGVTYSMTPSPGAVYGGMQPGVSDDASVLRTAQHSVFHSFVPGEILEAVDFGFTFNAITTTRDADDDPDPLRSVQGSLRQFIDNSNAIPGAQTSTFRIPVTDPGYAASPLSYTIQPLTQLPTLSDQVRLDASSQPGYSGAPIVVLDGSGLGLVDGLVIAADRSEVRGFVVQNFGDDGIQIDGNRNVVAGNYVGIDVSGSTPAGNDDGILVFGDFNVVGGPSSADRNVAAGNADDGISIDGGNDNRVLGNHVGVDVSGSAAIPNRGDGVAVQFGATRNIIGGQNSNVISGNSLAGVRVQSTGTDANQVLGNHIGVAASGSIAVPNGTHGIHITSNALNTVVGGSLGSQRNLVSGNVLDGILIDQGATGSVILGNYLGVGATGTTAIPNGGSGIFVDAADTVIGGTGTGEGNVISGNSGDGIRLEALDATVQGNLIGTDSTANSALGNGGAGIDVGSGTTGSLIGGTTAGAGNVIAFNAGPGVAFRNLPGPLGAVLANSIHSNGALGLDLGADGVTPNDPGDGDSGPNDLLNSPVITSAFEATGVVTVDFELDVPAGDYRVEFFSNPSGEDPTGYGEGELLVSTIDLAHTGSGVETFSLNFWGSAGDVITATATRCTSASCVSFDATSEFSGTFVVFVANRAPVLDPVGDVTAAEHTLISFTVTATDPDSDNLTYTMTGAPSGAALDPATGEFTWTPSESQGPAAYPFTITVTDNGTPNLTDSQTVTITVTETNTRPTVTNPGNQTNNESDTINLQITATDPDNPANTLTWTATGLPPGLTINTTTGQITGTITATAADNSPYTTTITTTDNGTPNLTDQTTLTWTINHTVVNNPPDPVDDIYDLAEDTSSVLNVTVNDSDPDGDALTVISITQPASGTVSISGTASVFFVPASDYNGVASFTYTVADGSGNEAQASVVVVIRAVNDAPSALSDSFQITTYRPNALDVLANDFDPDGDSLEVSILEGPGFGIAEIKGGVIEYTAPNGSTGTTQLRYMVTDPAGLTSDAVATITVSEKVLVGATTLAQSLGVDELSFKGASPAQLDTSQNLDLLGIPLMSLLASAFFQSIEALRIPLSILGLAIITFLGFGAASRMPGLIFGRSSRYWSVVHLSRERDLKVYSEPGGGHVFYRLDPTTAGIPSIGKAVHVGSKRWLPIETPAGDGWVDQHHLTEQVDLRGFMEDPRPPRLARELAEHFKAGRDFSTVLGPRGLLVGLTGPPTKIPPSHIATILGDSKVRVIPLRKGALADRGEFQKAVVEPFLEAFEATGAVTAANPHSRKALIPSELWNFPYLAFGVDEDVQPWLVFFEYRKGKAWITGLAIDE